jgi:hypothetical protein
LKGLANVGKPFFVFHLLNTARYSFVYLSYNLLDFSINGG